MLKGRSSFILLGLLSCMVFTACGKPLAHQMTSTQEAYQLMDKGENAKAALVLEKALRDNPDDAKARKLLGTAYVGLAGIDIYSIQDAFQDVLFRRSLKEQVFSPSKNEGSSQNNSPSNLKGGEKMMRNLDSAIVSIQKLLVYVDRFPQVPKEKWPFLERALTELQGLNKSSDVPVYRMLVRMIYLKSYLVENVVRDENFGTRKWACTFDVNDLDEGMTFVGQQIQAIKTDLDLAVKLGAKRLAQASGTINSLASQAEINDAILALQESRTVQEGESRLRSLLGCEKI